MPIPTLLDGKATGTPLFLAWMLGLVVFVGVTQTLKWAGLFRYFGNIFGVWIVYTACCMLYATWQAALLVSTRSRRVGWLSAALLASFLSMIGMMNVFEPITGAALLQVIPLRGERRRAWLWFAVTAVALFVLYAAPFEKSYILYAAFHDYLNKFVHRGFIIEYPLLVLAIVMSALGVVAAFFMPPVLQNDSTKQNVEN